MNTPGPTPPVGDALDLAGIATQIDGPTNRIPGPLLSVMQADVDAYTPGLNLDPVQWLAESPSGIAAIDAMMAQFDRPLVDDPKITEPDLTGWYNSAIKNGKIEPPDLVNFQTKLAAAWRGSAAIAGVTPPTIQFLKPADAAAFAKRGAAIAIAFQVGTGKPTFPAAMEAIEASGERAFVNRDLGKAAVASLKQLTADVNTAVEARGRAIDVLTRFAQVNKTPAPDAAPIPDRPLQEWAKVARVTAFLAAAANAQSVEPPAAGR